MDNITELNNNLNASEEKTRLESLSLLLKAAGEGRIPVTRRGNDVNNHIHTFYSFSPYSPSGAIWEAFRAGLDTAGIMDHDTIAGVTEFERAGKLAGIHTTSGVELRVSFKGTEFENRRINNPDQNGNAYIALHAVPQAGRNELEDVLRKVRKIREERNKLMLMNINAQTSSLGIFLDYEKDIVSVSKKTIGGTITERHLLFALSNKLVEYFGNGQNIISILENKMKLSLSDKSKKWLLDTENPYYIYDVLGVLKSRFVEKFYIEADENECPKVSEVVSLAKRIGSVSAYAYLGDVNNSVTGDKRKQQFEDCYLDKLVMTLHTIGFDAITYMPSRNTPSQLQRVKSLCDKYDLLQISGEDINSPRQNFVCEAARSPDFSSLRDSTYALIGSERAAKKNTELSMFSDTTKMKMRTLDERICYFKSLIK